MPLIVPWKNFPPGVWKSRNSRVSQPTHPPPSSGLECKDSRLATYVYWWWIELKKYPSGLASLRINMLFRFGHKFESNQWLRTCISNLASVCEVSVLSLRPFAKTNCVIYLSRKWRAEWLQGVTGLSFMSFVSIASIVSSVASGQWTDGMGMGVEMNVIAKLTEYVQYCVQKFLH